MPEHQPHILLVEDDQSIRDTVCELLRDEGFRVQTACHGAAAMEYLRCGCRPQMILLDLMMPVMDGWQLLRLLKADHTLQDIPVVVVSAARDGEPDGAEHFLSKPVDLASLLDTVERCCSRFDAHDPEAPSLEMACAASQKNAALRSMQAQRP